MMRSRDRMRRLFEEMAQRAQEPHRFVSSYRCYSISMYTGRTHQEADNGGKILLPPSTLHYLTQLHISYPMLFKLTSLVTGLTTHCGVLEFVAEEGKMYIPYWMMRNLGIDEGDVLELENAELPVASYSKFEPLSSEFLAISNPKAMLENALRNFACLTTGDVIAIRYNDKVYELRVLETRPGQAVNIIECDMDVEFAKPVDYVEPGLEGIGDIKETTKSVDAQVISATSSVSLFPGGGQRLDGKVCAASPCPVQTIVARGTPDYDFKIGQLSFARNLRPALNDQKTVNGFQPFDGTGSALKD